MYIVTGGAGFMGSNLVRGLNRRGIDDLEHGDKHKNLNSLEFRALVDYREFLELLPKLGKIDAMLHQGVCSDTTEANGRYMLSGE